MEWAEARDVLRTPIFAPLQGLIERLPIDRWPETTDLDRLAEGLTTGRGRRLRFVAPREHTDRERRYYELHIADTGEIETRARNWHDLFNALAWIAYPRAKAAINAQHAAILEERGEQEGKQRSPERDALTLFDEGGVIVAATSPDTFDRIVDFRWKELFWTQRARLQAEVRFLAFGHALFEKGLKPYIGMVAKTVFLPVEPSFPLSCLETQLAQADERLARHFADRRRFPSPRAMAPMPVLGVPGWHPDTEREAFYDDPVHFRASTRKPAR